MSLVIFHMRSKPSSRAAKPRRTGAGHAPARSAAIVWRSASAAETVAVGKRLGQALRGGEVLALRGELGAGKTTLVRGLAEGLGVPPAHVTSPTFVFVHLYRGRVRLAHADLYRLADGGDIRTLGLEDFLDRQTVLAIEWAEYGSAVLPGDRLEIELLHRTPAERQVNLHATGPHAEAVLIRLRHRQTARPRSKVTR